MDDDAAGSRAGAGHRAARLGDELVRIVAVLGAAALSATVLGFFGGWLWLFDLVANFRLHLLVGMLPCSVVLLLRRGWRRWGALCAAGLLANAWCVAPLWLAAPPAEAGAPGLRIVTFNVRTANERKAEVVAWLAAARADVLVLFEVDEAWLAALAPLRARLPHGMTLPRLDNFGTAVLTAAEPLRLDVLRLGPVAAPSVEVVLPWASGALTVFVTHPFPPVGSTRARWRDGQLAAVAEYLARRGPGPAVLVGDLNATPWSAAFRALCATARLRDSGRGFGWQPTWPASLGSLGIPIDHCLLGGALTVTARRVGPGMGSDHRPLLVELAAAR